MSPEAADDYSDITFFWTCETETADYSAGDTTATAGSAAELSTTQKKYGSKSIYIPTSYDVMGFDSSGIASGTSSFQFGLWLRIGESGNGIYGSFIGTNEYWVGGWDSYYVGTDGGKFAARLKGSGSNFTGYPLFSANTWYYYNQIINTTTENVKIYLDGVLVLDVTDADASTLSFTQLYFGDVAGEMVDGIYIDNPCFSSDITRDMYTTISSLEESPK